MLLYKKYAIQGFRNVKYVYRDDIEDPIFDAFNIDEFINELLKGIHLSSINYERLHGMYQNALKIL